MTILDYMLYPFTYTLTHILPQKRDGYESIPIEETNQTQTEDTNDQTTQNVSLEDVVIKSRFIHLRFMGQSYWKHFQQTMTHSGRCVKCSFYFFMHALWPDWYQHTASDIIVQLNDEILAGYEQRFDEFSRYI